MRTTLTLDEDLALQLKRLSRERQQPFKRVLNEALRAGLGVIAEPRRTSKRYRIHPVSLGTPRLPSLDDIGEVLAVADGDAYP